MKNRIVAGFITVASLLMGGRQASACGADNECKGDRICENQICVSPKAPAPAVTGSCRADIDCPANNLCNGGVCSPALAPEAVAPPPGPPPPSVQPTPEQGRTNDRWQFSGQELPPQPLPPPVMVMRNPRLRRAGIAFVTIGVAMEIVGIAMLASSGGACAGPPQAASVNPEACSSMLGAGSSLILFGIPFIANGAWMWPVGGAMVPQEQASSSSVKPFIVARKDGGGFGLQLTF